MKKTIAFFLLLPFTLYSTFADYGDIMLVKNSPGLVRELPNSSSEITAELKEGYIVLEQENDGNKWSRVRLTDGKEGYILNFNLGYNAGNLNEIKGNYGSSKNMSLLRRGPTYDSNPMGLILKGDKFRIINLNYFLKDWIRIELLDGKSKGKNGFINKKDVFLHCDYNLENSNLYSIFSIDNTINHKDLTYCGRKIVNQNFNEEEYIDLNSADENVQQEDSGDGIIDLFQNMINEQNNNTSNNEGNISNQNTELNSAEESVEEDFMNLFNDIVEDSEQEN